MDTEVVDEESIDTEALQAQIDLSMSFAQSLVSSWMEPTKLPPSPRKRDLEKELSEYMKRPPRLGVGALIPEGHQNISREAARLKGKLTGTGKRLRESEDVSAPPRHTEDNDDEGESRAGAIKKKQKPQLFSKSKKQRRGSLARNEHVSSLQNSTPAEDLTLTKNMKSGTVVASPTQCLSEPDRPTSPTSTLSNSTIPRNSIHADLLKRPLLNLTGPPANSDDGGSDTAEAGAIESPVTSPKKKRKRRKKKKHHLITEPPT